MREIYTRIFSAIDDDTARVDQQSFIDVAHSKIPSDP